MMSVSPKLVHQENSDTKEIEKPKEEREEFVQHRIVVTKAMIASNSNGNCIVVFAQKAMSMVMGLSQIKYPCIQSVT